MTTEVHPTHAKAVAVHPLATEATSLREEIVKAYEKLREEVAKLRKKVEELQAKAQDANLSKHNQVVFDGQWTGVESALNVLDPDSIARAS